MPRLFIIVLLLLLVRHPVNAASGRLANLLDELAFFQTEPWDLRRRDLPAYPAEPRDSSSISIYGSYDDWLRQTKATEKNNVNSFHYGLDLVRTYSGGHGMLRLVNAPLSAHADRFDLTRFHDDIPSITVGYHLRSGRFRTGVAVEKTEAFLSGQFDIQTFPTNPNPLVNLFLLDQLSPVFGSRYHMEGHHSKQDVTAEVAVDILPKLSAGIRSTYSSRWGRTDVGYYSSRAVRDRTAALTAAGSSFMAEPYTVWRSGKYLMVAGATFDRTDAAASMDPQDADPALEIVHWCDLQSNNRQQNFFFEFARGKPGRLLRIEGRYSSLHNTFSGRISTPVLTYFMFLPVVHRATGSADGHLITRSITMTYDYSFSNGRLLLRPSATFFDANYDINARATTQLAAGLVSASYSRTMRWDNIRLASISLESEYRLTPTLRLNLHAAQLIPVDEIHDDFDRAETRAPFSGGGALQPLAPASNSHIWGGTTVGASLNWSF